MAANDEERREGLEEKEEETWGTWEELLLVSAVNKHGLNNWDSVAMEIQNRITSSPHFILTPHNCKERYQHLRRRFHEGLTNESETDKEAVADAMPCLEELRKLRVAELRREVEQYDASIVSLQLKVKRLTEERELSLKGKEIREDEPDLERVRSETEKKENKIISGGDSDRENQSFNESNSTDPKDENQRVTVVDESDKKEAVAGELGPIPTDSNRPGEGSCNGSSETIAKDSVGQAFQKSSEPTRAAQPGEVTELWESVAESKGGGGQTELTKENSDVQSSASLSKERKREKDVAVSSNGEEVEIDATSPAIKRVSVKSHPLAKILEMIKSHKYGYVFEKRLKSQENSKYKSMIRQHMDLERINKQLKDGQYSGCSRKFFRDLLLLINNAVVFFPRNSVEFTAATELRQIVSKEMSSRIRKASQSPDAQTPPAIPLPTLPKTEPEPCEPLVVKPKTSVPLVACRKRSSISSKGGASVVGEKKFEKKEPVVEEKKPVVDRKQQDNRVPSLVEEPLVIKKGKRDRPASGARSARPVGKTQNNSISNKPPISNTNRNPSPSSSSKGGVAVDENLEKAEKEKKVNMNSVSKRRSAANFLNRMKKNASSNASLIESLDSPENNPDSVRVEPKKSNVGKGDGRKEQSVRNNSSRKRSEQSSPGKKSVGRPPKKNSSSSPVPAPMPPPPSKRGRETLETEAMAPKKPQKRPRR